MTFYKTTLLHAINISNILRAEHRGNLEINVEWNRTDSGFTFSQV